MNSKLSKILSIAMAVLCAVAVCQTVNAQEAAVPAADPEAAPATVPAAVPTAVPAEAPAAAPAATVPAAPAAAITSALELRKTGTISVTKDAGGKVTGMKLIVNSYEIPLDEGSKPMESMDGQKVRVTGTFSSEGGKRLFYVKSVEPAAADIVPATPAK